MDRIRAFVALPLPQQLRPALLQLAERIVSRASGSPSSARATRPDSLHLTLKFLGDVAPGQVQYFRAELHAAARDSSPIETWLEACVAFPTVHRARVIVAALDDRQAKLAALAERFQRAGVSVGVPAETRPFRPHVTLVRLKRPCDVSTWLDSISPPRHTCDFDQLILYRSVLKPSGPTYTVLEQAPLR
jgi:2'-5' RNA ligase